MGAGRSVRYISASLGSIHPKEIVLSWTYLSLRRLALQLVVSRQAIAQAFDLKGTQARRRRQESAAWLTQSGKDPNWRRRRSVLDQFRGWNRQSARRNYATRDDRKSAA
jgi:hypothetical protein